MSETVGYLDHNIKIQCPYYVYLHFLIIHMFNIEAMANQFFFYSYSILIIYFSIYLGINLFFSHLYSSKLCKRELTYSALNKKMSLTHLLLNFCAFFFSDLSLVYLLNEVKTKKMKLKPCKSSSMDNRQK